MKTVLERLRNDGYAVLKGVLPQSILKLTRKSIGREYQLMQKEGEPVEDEVAREATGHDMANLEKKLWMTRLMLLVADVINGEIPACWWEVDRQVVYREAMLGRPYSDGITGEFNSFEVGHKPYHVDGLTRVIERKAEDNWPIFQLLAVIPLVKIRKWAQGGLMVRRGSHLEVIQKYNEALGKGQSHSEALKTLQQWQMEQSYADDGTLLMVRPGDLVLCHSLVSHTADDICDPKPDVKVFFRFKATRVVGPMELKKPMF